MFKLLKFDKKIVNNVIYSFFMLLFILFIEVYVLSWYYNLIGWSIFFNIIFKGVNFLREYL